MKNETAHNFPGKRNGRLYRKKSWRETVKSQRKRKWSAKILLRYMRNSLPFLCLCLLPSVGDWYEFFCFTIDLLYAYQFFFFLYFPFSFYFYSIMPPFCINVSVFLFLCFEIKGCWYNSEWKWRPKTSEGGTWYPTRTALHEWL